MNQDFKTILHVHSDGGSRGNPGPGALGVVIEIVFVKKEELSLLNNSQFKKDVVNKITASLHKRSYPTHLRTTIVSFGKRLGITTNNKAEYDAVIEGYLWLNTYIRNTKDFLPQYIIWCVDSLLVKEQLSGVYKIKDSILREKAHSIFALQQKINIPILYIHVERNLNTQADIEVNKAFDKKTYD
jgi:ribonuclease HI